MRGKFSRSYKKFAVHFAVYVLAIKMFSRSQCIYQRWLRNRSTLSLNFKVFGVIFFYIITSQTIKLYNLTCTNIKNFFQLIGSYFSVYLTRRNLIITERTFNATQGQCDQVGSATNVKIAYTQTQ